MDEIYWQCSKFPIQMPAGKNQAKVYNLLDINKNSVSLEVGRFKLQMLHSFTLFHPFRRKDKANDAITENYNGNMHPG